MNFIIFSLFSTTYSLTCSAISSGACMCTQFHVAFSSSVKAAGLIAAAPYYCAQNSHNTAVTTCSKYPDQISLSSLISTANSAAGSGYIDPVSNLAKSSVFIYAGTNDTIVNPQIGQVVVNFYQNFVTSGTVVTNFNTPSEHAWINDIYGNACNYLGPPYMNNCNLDLPGIMLSQFYGKLNPRVMYVTSNLIPFNQSVYGDVVQATMSTIGYVYVPTGCKVNRCEVHVCFHGCKQSAEVIGTTFVQNTGLNNWAESNNIVILYPQISAQSQINNPNGCWDWWGFTGPDYAFKSGKQMALVFAMTQNPPVVSWSN